MDQNRQDSTFSTTSGSTQQQNVHLHMHHVCGCNNPLYTSSYFPPLGYRTHVPQMMAYTPPQPIPRPYLQHYQYTQFNLAGQYPVPISHVSPVSSLFGSSSQHNMQNEVYGQSSSRRERSIVAETDCEKPQNEPPAGYEYGQITPPANELLVTDSSDNPQITTENFVKFLEKSCLTAEQIAYRNRNRPCFRNIQNLCVRTRSEILKPCTTISNIHSQGIPWATKDFIYAFVRLTNCWHILKGYWENRDGCSLGKIERELTPEFRSCYARWEKETIDLAAQLTRVFYNLDTNLSNPVPNINVHTANNLIPPQVNLLKASSSENTLKNNTWNDSASSTTVTITNNSSKNIRGILHLPSSSVPAETVDQGNQTCAGDFCGNGREEGNETDDEIAQAKVYMKPGSYNVPKKHTARTAVAPAQNEPPVNSNNSPRTIEFLRTAQNVNRAKDLGKKIEQKVTKEEAVKITNIETFDEYEVPSHFNVHEWLISSRFSDCGEPTTPPTSPPDVGSYFMDVYPHQESINHLPIGIEPLEKAAITLLQRDKVVSGVKPNPSLLPPPKLIGGKLEISSRGFGSRSEIRISSSTRRDKMAFYEEKDGGLTNAGVAALEKVLSDINTIDLTCLFGTAKDHFFSVNLDGIQKKITNKCYEIVIDAVKDILQCIKSATIFLDCDNEKKIEAVVWDLLDQNIPGYDFSDLKTETDIASQLKMKNLQYEKNGDH